MRLLFIGDIHGVPSTLEAALKMGDELGYDKIVLLGDLLYHGPRNGVPNFYDPVKVAQILNARKDQIIAVRGNCDAEVDQMMLQFPISADYQTLEADGEKFFFTHGHHFNADNLPPIGMYTMLCHGHTHIAELTRLECGVTIFNPGSISLPKGGQSRQFGYWNGQAFSHYAISKTRRWQ